MHNAHLVSSAPEALNDVHAFILRSPAPVPGPRAIVLPSHLWADQDGDSFIFALVIEREDGAWILLDYFASTPGAGLRSSFREARLAAAHAAETL